MSDLDRYAIFKKQFIAGAICPECDAVDRIVVELARCAPSDEELSRRRCVECGFTDPFASVQSNVQAIPKGRPERPKSAKVEARAVKIMDPNNDK